MSNLKQTVHASGKSGFTMVELIAVLVVIAIMAAVAIPKFLSIADDAKNGMAQAGVNEAKASLTVSYSKAYLAAGGTPTIGSIFTNVFPTTPQMFGDIQVDATQDGTNKVSLTATYQTTGNATGLWVMAP